MDSEVLLNVSHKLSVSVLSDASDIVDMWEIAVAFVKSVLADCIGVPFSGHKTGARGSPDSNLLRSDLI